MATIQPNPKQAYFNPVTGAPLIGGKLYTYAPGTNTPKDTFADSANTTPNTNPVVLDARGEALIYWDGLYRIQLQDALGSVIYTVDNYGNGAGAEKRFENVTDMVAQAGSYDGQIIQTTSFAASAASITPDGGGSVYVWRETSTATVDNIFVFAQAGPPASGRFHLVPISSEIRGAQVGIFPNGTDYTGTLQAVCDKANSLGGLTLKLDVGTYVGGFVLKTGFHLEGMRNTYGLGVGTAIQTTLQKANAAGDQVTSDGAASVRNASIVGIKFYGRGSGVAGRAVVIGQSRGVEVRDCSADNYADEAFVFTTLARVYKARSLFAQNCLLNRTRASASYVVDFQGGDYIAEDIEATPSVSGLTNANKYCRGVRIGGDNGRVDNIIGEVADVGIGIEGSLHHIGRLRAEFNYAEGIIDSATNVQGTALFTTNNSQATHNTYSAYVATSASGNNVYQLHYDRNSNAALASQYAVDDQRTAGDSNKSMHGLVFGTSNGTGVFNYVAGGSSAQPFNGEYKTLTANSTTPRFDTNGPLWSDWITANSSPTSITDFLGTVPGQLITILCNDANTTLVHNGSKIILPGNGNMTLRSGRIYQFKNYRGVIRYVAGSRQFTQPDVGDLSFNAQVGTTGIDYFCATALTANRTFTISTLGAISGDKVRFTRTAASTGGSTYTAFTKALATGQWVEGTYDGAAWYESAFGSL